MSTESTPPFKSSYPPIAIPEGGFQSKLPEHLLEDCDDQTKWLMHEMSKNSQAIEWACHVAVDTNRQTRETNGRLLKAEAQLKDDKTSVDALTVKADLMEPIFKPIALFMRLWDYKWFRWICYAALFFFFTYLLPWYLKNPVSIDMIVTHLLGP